MVSAAIFLKWLEDPRLMFLSWEHLEGPKLDPRFLTSCTLAQLGQAVRQFFKGKKDVSESTGRNIWGNPSY